MHGGSVAKNLPARPNLDHLRRQAKTLLAQLKDGDAGCRAGVHRHLPEARKLTPDAVRGAGFRLADAQSVVARQTGFASWPALSRHVQQLRALEGDWRFVSLEVDGTAMPAESMTHARLLIDGDRFRMESPEATYEGIFTIDVERHRRRSTSNSSRAPRPVTGATDYSARGRPADVLSRPGRCDAPAGVRNQPGQRPRAGASPPGISRPAGRCDRRHAPASAARD